MKVSEDRYILEGKSFIDTKTNQCLNFGVKDLARVAVELNLLDKELEYRIECYKTARDLYWDENAKAFDYRDLYEKEQEKVNQLKQQLAEKDAEVQSWKDGTMVVKLGKLEHQLAEKEKEHKEAMYSALNDFLQLRKEQNQTAIAELEKVKKLIRHKGFVLKMKPPITMPTTPMNEYLNEFMILEDDFNRIFDQQIKELKGEK